MKKAAGISAVTLEDVKDLKTRFENLKEHL